MKGLAFLRLRDEPSDEPSHDRTDDADEGSREKAHWMRPGHDGAGDETNEKTDDDGPEDMEHIFSFFGRLFGEAIRTPGEVNAGMR